MLNEQRIRGILFYLSVSIFFLGIPFILSHALGYKFNPRTLKFTQTGLISIKTQPQGAHIYLDSRLLNEKSPSTLSELLPGSYNIRLELENYYPWGMQVDVHPRRITRIEKVILFPKRLNIKQLNKDSVSYFYIDQGKKSIYYFNRQDSILYESDLEGEKFKELSILPKAFKGMPKGLKLSEDKEKILLFNNHQICILYLSPKGSLLYGQNPLILDYPRQQIIQVFWHSDSYHLILVTDRNISVLETNALPNEVSLVNLNSFPSGLFYEVDRDSLYFSDYQMGDDGAVYENVYKLEFSEKASIINNVVKLRQNERE
ncbi:MAG: PEGA domain-containing protein [Candidatus Omnitrophica bacterium]|jgi:hypothetical protein|nr:PEGA domain-containing protein [Candidatus Omnitrophota bacterium]MDD3988116.1 PEGA domain-containing protein [Candidatus Omnitrophota bacterium]MDD4981532.1 PEGA domain-containing protein [Candidatus Omnitrophota bacterium]MDD5665299.1 PEGA domain-containing protein [Candidatus Omnitrophota bacterium]